MQSNCSIIHCPSRAHIFSPRLGSWFCSLVCESHAAVCEHFRLPLAPPTGGAVETEFLQLATVGAGVFLAPSTITFTESGESIGLGLFAGRDFQPREPITEYYGYFFKDSAVPEDKLEHAIEAAGGWVIDGTRTASGDRLTDPIRQLMALKVGGAAYANDLDYPRVTGMRPGLVTAPSNAVTNAVFRRVMDADTKARVERGEPIAKNEVAIFLEASTFIPLGAEIFVSYSLVAYVSIAPREPSSRRKQSAPKRRGGGGASGATD